jgi:hypothetical protein
MTRGQATLSTVLGITVGVALYSALTSGGQPAPLKLAPARTISAPAYVQPDLDTVLHFGGRTSANTRPVKAGPDMVVSWRYWGNVSSPGKPADPIQIAIEGTNNETELVDEVQASGHGQATVSPGQLPGQGGAVYIAVTASGHWAVTIRTNGPAPAKSSNVTDPQTKLVRTGTN